MSDKDVQNVAFSQKNKYFINEVYGTNPIRPNNIAYYDGNKVNDVLYVYPNLPPITMEQAQAICDLLNNWEDKDD